jgi:hypothetical protein
MKLFLLGTLLLSVVATTAATANIEQQLQEENEVHLRGLRPGITSGSSADSSSCGMYRPCGSR